MQIHPHSGGPPSTISATRIEQTAAGLRELVLRGVRLRVPLEDGAVHLRAPRATYSPRAVDRGVFEGPVVIHAMIGERPAVGRADAAALVVGGERLRFEDLILVVAGQRQRSASVVVDRNWGAGGETTAVPGEPLTRPANALIGARLAGLPDGLELPAIPVERPQE